MPGTVEARRISPSQHSSAFWWWPLSVSVMRHTAWIRCSSHQLRWAAKMPGLPSDWKWLFPTGGCQQTAIRLAPLRECPFTDAAPPLSRSHLLSGHHIQWLLSTKLINQPPVTSINKCCPEPFCHQEFPTDGLEASVKTLSWYSFSFCPVFFSSTTGT